MGGRNLDQPLTSEAFVHKVIKRSRERSPSLGDLCSYDLKGVEILPNELFDMLSELGLEKWQPVPIRKKTAARKAITRMKHTLEDPTNDLKVIVRPVPTLEPDVYRYAIIDETVDYGAIDLDYETRNQVIFRSDTSTIDFSRETNQDILKEFEYMCSVYTDTEILRMVKNIVTNHGCIWFRDFSGMFFMPYGLKEVVDSLVELFDRLSELTNSVCYFRPVAILNDADNRATMGEALISDISFELEEATQFIDKAVQNKDKNKRAKISLTAALKRFKIAKGKASIYKDMLKINLDDIERKVSESDAHASKLLIELTNKQDDKSN